MSKYKTGDVVVLKAGGPRMTVEYAGEAPRSSIYCIWFDGAELRSAHITEDSLELAEGGDP